MARITAKARAAALLAAEQASTVETITATATAPKGWNVAETSTPELDIDTEIGEATLAVMDSMDSTKGRVARMAAAIRIADKAGRTKDQIGAVMMRYAVMGRMGVNSDQADKELEVSPRPDHIVTILNSLKAAKSRAYSLIKAEDAGEDTRQNKSADKKQEAAKEEKSAPVETVEADTSGNFADRVARIRVQLENLLLTASNEDKATVEYKGAKCAIPMLTFKKD